MKLLIILLMVGIKMITLVNYLDTRVVVESGSYIANLLTRNYGYVLIGKKLPEPPWTLVK